MEREKRMERTTTFRRLGTMLDCSRNAVMTVPSLKKWIDLTASLGYNTLLLYTTRWMARRILGTCEEDIPKRNCGK